MFDDITNINIKQTDPTVGPNAKFLDELTKEAEKRMHEAILVNIPSIKVELVDYKYATSSINYKTKHYLACKINGKDEKILIEQDDYETSKIADEEYLKFVCDQISKELVRQVILKGDLALIKKGFTK